MAKILQTILLVIIISCCRAFVLTGRRILQTPPTSTTTTRGMFTGIVEEMGTIVSMEERDDMVLWDGSKGKGTELTVKANVVLEGAYLG